MVDEVSKAHWETSRSKQEPRADGSACPSFWLFSKIKCGSLPFLHRRTAEGPPCLAVGGWFDFDFICVLGFFYRSRACLRLDVVTIDNLPPGALVLLGVGGDS